MADDLIKTLDEAAAKVLEKALEGANFQDQVEAFKMVAAWAERRAKLIPDKTPKGGTKFDELRGKLRPAPKRAAKRSGTSAEDDDGEDAPTRPDA